MGFFAKLWRKEKTERFPQEYGSLSADPGNREGSPRFQAVTHLYPWQMRRTAVANSTQTHTTHSHTVAAESYPPSQAGIRETVGEPAPPGRERGRKKEARQI